MKATDQQIIEIQQNAVGIAEGWTPYGGDLDDEVVLKIAWQYLVDTGMAYRLKSCSWSMNWAPVMTCF